MSTATATFSDNTKTIGDKIAGLTLKEAKELSDYIKEKYLKPRIDWASTLVVLITHDTAHSDWVKWEIKYAIEQGKNVIGVYAQGATDADIPEELGKHAAAIVGWQSDRVVDAINGTITGWDDPATGAPRTSGEWTVKRYSCG